MTSVLRRSDERGGFVRCQLPTISFDSYLDRLVRTTSNQAGARHVKRGTEYARLRLERTRLRYVFHILERCPSRIVPERH